jgi:hypothetical protein
MGKAQAMAAMAVWKGREVYRESSNSGLLRYTKRHARHVSTIFIYFLYK